MRLVGLVAALGVIALAAGCASTRTPAVSTLSGVSPSAPTSAQTSPAHTAAQNRQAADDEARRLLALAPKPPGAKMSDATPSAMAGPALGAPMTTSLVEHTVIWQVSMSLDDSVSWLHAHGPAGMSELGSSSSSGGSEPTRGLAWSPEGEAIAGVIGMQLQIDVAATDADSSTWRVDAVDEWLDPVPIRDDAAGPRMRVTIAAGCPSTDKGKVGVNNDGADLEAALLPDGAPTAALICDYDGQTANLARSVKLEAAAAARLAVAANASQLSHLDDAHRHCPADFGSVAVLAFSYPGRPDVDLDYRYTGCPSVANGHIRAQPSDALYTLADPRAEASSPAP